MSATPIAVRTACRCWIAAFGSRNTRTAAVWDIGGIVIFFVSRTVWPWLNVLLPGVPGWFSSSLVSFCSLRLATVFVLVKVPSLSRASIGRPQPRWSFTHCLRHSIASTCWFINRVSVMTSTARESATKNGLRNRKHSCLRPQTPSYIFKTVLFGSHVVEIGKSAISRMSTALRTNEECQFCHEI